MTKQSQYNLYAALLKFVITAHLSLNYFFVTILYMNWITISPLAANQWWKACRRLKPPLNDSIDLPTTVHQPNPPPAKLNSYCLGLQMERERPPLLHPQPNPSPKNAFADHCHLPTSAAHHHLYCRLLLHQPPSSINRSHLHNPSSSLSISDTNAIVARPS